MPYVNANVLRGRFPTPELLIHFVDTQLAIEAPLVRRSASVDGDPYLCAAEVLNARGIDVPATAEEFRGDEPLIQRIVSNKAFFGACALELSKSGSLRVSIVGPTFLEPEWLHEREGRLDPTENFSLGLRRRLFDGTLDCEIVLRNVHDRYRANLGEFIGSEEEWQRLLDGMLVDSYQLFGEHGESGPRLRCLDPGYNHIPHIFDGCALIGSRRTSNERVAGGWRVSQPDLVDLERERWANMFEAAEPTQSGAVTALRAFIADLRTANPRVT